jgi:hypothetical protein
VAAPETEALGAATSWPPETGAARITPATRVGLCASLLCRARAPHGKPLSTRSLLTSAYSAPDQRLHLPGTGNPSKRGHSGGVGVARWDRKNHEAGRGPLTGRGNLYPFWTSCTASLLTNRRSMHGRGSKHAVCRHKKDVHTAVEIHYNQSCHEHTPHGGGLARVAGQSCLAGP